MYSLMVRKKHTSDIARVAYDKERWVLNNMKYLHLDWVYGHEYIFWIQNF